MEFIQTIGKLIVRYHSFFEEGIVNTLIIAAFTVFFGTIFGTLMSSMRMSKILPLKWLAVAYIEFIRGTPLMVQLMFIFYGLPWSASRCRTFRGSRTFRVFPPALSP